MDISQRLFRLMRSITEDKFESIGRFIDEGTDFLDERLKFWESEYEVNREEPNRYDRQDEQQDPYRPEPSPFSQQLREDLQLFGLTPPSSLEAVRQVRNTELKKFHPDKYLDQPDKLETAKRIVQIYNTTYDRLKKHFGTNAV